MPSAGFRLLRWTRVDLRSLPTFAWRSFVRVSVLLMGATPKYTETKVQWCDGFPGRMMRGSFLGMLALVAWGQVTVAQAAESASQPPSPSAAQQYDADFISIDATRIGGYFVSAPPGHAPGYVFPSDTWDAYRGRAQAKLGLLEFYDLVDRPDLRSKALRHYILQGSFGLAGFGLVLGGGIYEYIHLTREPSTAPVGGWLVMGAGVACFITAYLLGPRPITAEQAAALATRHNTRLRLQLGLPPAIDSSSERGSMIRFARSAPSFPALLGTPGFSLTLRL